MNRHLNYAGNVNPDLKVWGGEKSSLTLAISSQNIDEERRRGGCMGRPNLHREMSEVLRPSSTNLAPAFFSPRHLPKGFGAKGGECNQKVGPRILKRREVNDALTTSFPAG